MELVQFQTIMQTSLPTLRKVHSSLGMNNQVSPIPAGGGIEKTKKIRKEEESRTRTALMFLGIMGLLFVAAMVKLRHNHDIPKSRHFGKLRSHGISKVSHALESVSHINKSEFIPPNSLYQLSVSDLTGATVSLSKFFGSVTLIVNVACM